MSTIISEMYPAYLTEILQQKEFQEALVYSNSLLVLQCFRIALSTSVITVAISLTDVRLRGHAITGLAPRRRAELSHGPLWIDFPLRTPAVPGDTTNSTL
uniref:Uncharacterized protein n=1 Tax=Sphaerodactylus townsendi TaxID=933632 RepID=A0ACB8EN86_9SAUR